VVTDLGFAKRARTFAELLDAPLAIVEKRRIGNQDRTEVLNVIGDVRGKRAIIVDDEIDTAGTLIQIVNALQREGVTEMYACATHAILSDPSVERIDQSQLREVVVTDSVPIPPEKRGGKIKVISLAPLIAEAIVRIHRGQSVGALFTSDEVNFTQEMLLWDIDGKSDRTPGEGANGRSGETAQPSGPADAPGRLTARRAPTGAGRPDVRPRRQETNNT
jgi:hypothetical protein